MRSYSLFSIILLCFVILLIDIFAFYWLQSITNLFNKPLLKTTINILFWFFTVGLITSILILKVKLDDITPGRKQNLIASFYGLTISSFVPKFIFVIIISILYFSNSVFSENESLIFIPIVGLLSGFLPFFVIANGIFKTRYNFKIHHVKLNLKTVPKAFEGFKIVQISDIHLGSFNYRYHILEKAVKLINEKKPDIICFTGDLVNNYSWELHNWEKVFKKLQAKKGKYAVLGNHDYGDYSEWETPEQKQENFNTIKQFFNDIDFKLLMNEGEIIELEKSKIAIIGVENWGNPPFKQYGDLKKAISKVKEVPFKILLSHDPSHWKEEVLNHTNINLTLSGHTHGMQAGVEYKNFKWSPIKFKYKQWAGLYKEGNQYLYVNRGLGWLGFPARIGMRPEITVFELASN